MVEHIMHKERLLAIVVRERFSGRGVQFFTPPEFSQQLAFMQHPEGRIIEPHVHNPVSKTVQYTQEVLFLRKGTLRVDFYDEERHYVQSTTLGPGDVILLAAGGHGFEALEDIEMFEVKQGPYKDDEDKTRFHGISRSAIRFKEGENV